MSASSSIARKAAVLVAGGGVYGTAVYMTYHMQLNKETSTLASASLQQEHSSNESSSAPNFSYLTNPLRTQQFQKIASIYDDRIGRDEFFTGILLLRRSLLYFHARGDVLEVGAGTARNLNYYKSNKAIKRAVLSDSSDQMLIQAKEKIQKLPPDKQRRFAVIQADASKLYFPDNTFDTVIDTFGLCSYDDPVAVLKEMSRVCKSNGKVLLLEHGRSKDWDFVTRHLDKYAERHAAYWGCVWNRDLDDIIRQPQCQLEIGTLSKYHFGTTYYVVCRPTKKQS